MRSLLLFVITMLLAFMSMTAEVNAEEPVFEPGDFNGSVGPAFEAGSINSLFVVPGAEIENLAPVVAPGLGTENLAPVVAPAFGIESLTPVVGPALEPGNFDALVGLVDEISLSLTPRDLGIPNTWFHFDSGSFFSGFSSEISLKNLFRGGNVWDDPNDCPDQGLGSELILEPHDPCLDDPNVFHIAGTVAKGVGAAVGTIIAEVFEEELDCSKDCVLHEDEKWQCVKECWTDGDKRQDKSEGKGKGKGKDK